MLYASSIETLVMPGKVISGHADLEEECSNCHEIFSKKSQNKLCLDCHKDIKKDLKNKFGFHGKNKNIRKQECRTCHTEHKGRKADIVKLDKSTFDHRFTDFLLRGAHSKARYANCHKAKKKYREAEKYCSSCHKSDNPHKSNRLGKYARKCASCHTEKNWGLIHFKHNKTKFALTGKHKTINCAACHPSDRFLKTPRTCNSCHSIDDIHQGANGKNCKKCHSTRSWKSLSFNHNTDTDFPLKGGHSSLSCNNCHKKDPYKVKIKSTCISCHRSDDQHKGKFGNKCEKCHVESSWKKQKFNHQRDTKYPILGKHKHASCTDCHKGNLYRDKISKNCYGCHKVDDVHKRQEGKQCQRCHDENGWRKKVRFDHDISKFPLIGLHAVVPCEECHLSSKYKSTSSQCFSCHKEDDIHKKGLGEQCELCHNPNGWQVWRFDHNTQSKFKLDGSHKGLHCDNCHIHAVKKIESQPRSCFSCHRADDAHDKQFGTRCNRCHSTRSFDDVNFHQ